MRAARMVCTFLTGSLLFAQAPDPKLAFEVASVKLGTPPPNVPIPNFFLTLGGPGSNDPGQIHYSNISLQQLLIQAYGLKQQYQLSAPAWLNDARFDIEAKVPAGATRDDLNVMLQNLMIERFHLGVHHETKDLPGYELTLGKGNSKLHETPAADLAAAAGASAAAPGGRGGAIRMGKDKDGLPELQAGSKGLAIMGVRGGQRCTARAQELSALARFLENPLGKPVHDATGLKGLYDFNLTFSPDERTSANMVQVGPPAAGAANADDPGRPPDLFTALQEQLGLKLEQKKIPIDMLVVDRMDKTPTGN